MSAEEKFYLSFGNDSLFVDTTKYPKARIYGQDIFRNNKLDFFQKYIDDNKWSLSDCLYMGDDMADYQVMKQNDVLSVCPQDAADDILNVSDYVCAKNGGYGAVREVLEKMQKIQDNWIEL